MAGDDVIDLPTSLAISLGVTAVTRISYLANQHKIVDR